MTSSAMAALLISALAASSSALRVIKPSDKAPAVPTLVNQYANETMQLAARQNFQVELGPFGSAQEACEYCFSSFTKKGDPPAGPVAPFCVCMSYPDGGEHKMFCATPPSAAKYVAEKDGCRCKQHDMEAMGKDTCKKID